MLAPRPETARDNTLSYARVRLQIGDLAISSPASCWAAIHGMERLPAASIIGIAVKERAIKEYAEGSNVLEDLAPSLVEDCIKLTGGKDLGPLSVEPDDELIQICQQHLGNIDAFNADPKTATRPPLGCL